MEKVKERIKSARLALNALKEALAIENPSLLERDGTIQRFEFTYEAVWKAAQLFLREIEKTEVASPKGVVRDSYKAGILDEETAYKMLEMADARNLTVHTYNEEFAITIFRSTRDYCALLETWINAMQQRLEDQ